MADRFYDNLQGFSDLKYVAGILYGRLNGGEYQVIPTEGNPGEDGTDGVNAYLYVAYASDDQGTAFSLIPAANLKYIALLQSTTVISSPLASMFAGKWFQYLGDDGADGTDGVDGDDGLDAYVYVAYASDASGTAFNMTPSDSLKYRAEIHVSAPIASPGLSDFSGATWVKYIGNDGQNLVSSVNSKTGAVVLDASDVGAAASSHTHSTYLTDAPSNGTAYARKDGAWNAVSALTGSIQLYAASTPPTGYLECNGAAVSRTTYASLYDVIGTTYGVGDGSTTFNLPDMRGVVARGWDNGRGLDTSRTFGSYQDDAFQGHYHTIQYGGGTGQAEPMKLTYSYATQYTGMLDVGVLAPRSDGTNGTPRTAAETRMKNVALLYIIKY